MLIWSIKTKELASGKTVVKVQLTFEIKEHQKMVSCVAWAPNGDWIVSCSGKDFVGRLWDVGMKRGTKLVNGMVCTLKKHQAQITKIQFHTDTVLVSSS